MKKLVISLILISVMLNFFIILFPIFSSDYNSLLITGKSLLGTISLFVQGDGEIIIYSPENITYNYSNVSEDFILDLNVSANFFEADTWWYTLRDLRHGAVVEQNVTFTPNITFEAVRWENLLEVYANDSSGNVFNASVQFFVFVPNTAPILSNISEEIFVCEQSALSYDFNATDIDREPLLFGLTPTNPFFVNPSDWTSGGTEVVDAEIFSGVLGKNRVGVHPLTVSVSDGNFSDFKNTNVTVIEINNAPSVANIGAKTVWTQGEDSTFFHQVEVADVEDGTHLSGNFDYNLTFLTGNPFFNISSSGVMNVSPNSSHIGVYDLRVCVTDDGIDAIHPNISLCGQDGGPMTTCRDFSLTVTDNNRAPEITDFYPTNLTFSASGTSDLFFNITKHDFDGTIPDSYWYVDGALAQYVFGNESVDEFTYNFGCGVSGLRNVTVDITDGLLNDSMHWNITALNVVCPSSGGGGGGGGGGPACVEKWGCENWGTCQNADPGTNYTSYNVTFEQFLLVRSDCISQGFETEGRCGLQFRECYDANECNNGLASILKPKILQACRYVSAPSCSDGVKSCHSGSCEVGIDCGGACGACSTCSDGIQNQGEEGVDCGSPCPWDCEVEYPLEPFSINYFLVILISAFILAVMIIFIRIYVIRKRLKSRALQNG